METYYILIVIVLFVLAISDLIVGVSNDAVNFLNSAIGSKAASFRTILAVAALGVLIGAVFSNGMMEVARKGVFNPDQFAFSDIMVIFLAVMFTDILLLDFFNTVGLPTSTTVSIVFELLGAAVAVSVFKVAGMQGANGSLGDYINTERALIIIAGIFLSVVIAFTIGMIIQWVVRLAFSFNLKKTYKIWTGIWGGFAITAILYFLVIKGAKGSTLVTDEALEYIRAHTTTILLISFVGFSVLFQLLVAFTQINILKITVLLGTFALAMAFAGNDLVNFIGVPLAGFESFRDFTASGSADPGGFLMGSLQEPVSTPVYFLIGAGIVMVLTLRFSRKAKSVTATTIDLSRQGEGSERFASSSLARFLVRRSVEASNGVSKITPSRLSRFIGSRFREVPDEDPGRKKGAFDLVRASVNLVVASILIAFGTSLKLPLSTTYVTFMVAMGTSLADGAWGRESAVYRITGVLTVVGGWFFTAFTAFVVSFLIASLIFVGKFPVVLTLMALSIFIMIRTHAFHKKRAEKAEKIDREIMTASYDILKSFDEQVKKSVLRISKLLYLTYINLFKEKRKELKKIKKESRRLLEDVKELKDDIPLKLKRFEETEIESSQYYVQAVDYLRETSNSLMHIVMPAFRHVDNNHPLDKAQADSFQEFNNKTSEFFNLAVNLLQNRNFDHLDELVQQRDEIMEMINEIIKSRIKILKKAKKGVKISMTYIEMLTESKNLLLHLVQLVKAQKNLIETIEQKKKAPVIMETTKV
ncbi:MAG TPA: phosphate permease [Bacteroides sp.]|nr:phosphate permease [Bacteroides sp.]